MKQGWEEIKMVEACDILTCGVASTPNYVDEEIGIPFLSAQNVRDGDIVLDKYNFITKEFHQKLTTKNKPSKGDILYSRVGAKYGEAGVVEHNFEFSVYVSVTLIRPKKELLNNYFLKNYLNSPRIKDLARKSITSSGVPNLNVNSVREFPVPIPPLPEQQRIVSILDEAFVAIAKAKSNAEQNLRNAKELFESYLQGVFENGNWETKKLNEITEVKDGTHDSPKYIKEGIPFVTQKNIKLDGLTFDDTRFITDIDHEKFYKRSNVANGDILISMIGANRGMAAIVNDKRVFSIKNVGLIKSSVNINMNFLLHYLKSSKAMNYVLDMSNGGAQEFVGLTALRSFPIPLPSLKEQQSVVQKLDALSAETKKLEAIYQQKINDLEELKKSILQKAFSGELVTNKTIIL